MRGWGGGHKTSRVDGNGVVGYTTGSGKRGSEMI